MQGGSALPDRLVGSVDASKLDALVFVGGSGAALLFEDRAAHRMLVDARALGGAGFERLESAEVHGMQNGHAREVDI